MSPKTFEMPKFTRMENAAVHIAEMLAEYAREADTAGAIRSITTIYR